MRKNQGLIQLVILIAAVIVLLSFFGINLRKIFANDTVRENFAFVKEKLAFWWNAWIKDAVKYLWREISELLLKLKQQN